MRRYAVKRMRRKFKQQQRKKAKDADWRELYDETEGLSKGKTKKGKRSKKISPELGSSTHKKHKKSSKPAKDDEARS